MAVAWAVDSALSALYHFGFDCDRLSAEIGQIGPEPGTTEVDRFRPKFGRLLAEFGQGGCDRICPGSWEANQETTDNGQVHAEQHRCILRQTEND